MKKRKEKWRMRKKRHLTNHVERYKREEKIKRNNGKREEDDKHERKKRDKRINENWNKTLENLDKLTLHFIIGLHMYM